MTCTEKLCRANRWRIRKGVCAIGPVPSASLASTDEDGWNGHFLVPLEGEMWHVIISDGGGWRHLSVSNAQRKILPSWNIMCRLKDAFFDDEAWCVQFHPPKQANINDHPFCLHIWENIDREMPVPHYTMV